MCVFKGTGMVVPVLNHDGTTASFSEVLWGHEPADLHIPSWYGRPCCLSYIYPFRVPLYHLLSALHATTPRFLLGPWDPPCISAYTDRHNKLSKLMHWLAVAAALSQLEHSNQFGNSDIAPQVRPSPASHVFFLWTEACMQEFASPRHPRSWDGGELDSMPSWWFSRFSAVCSCPWLQNLHIDGNGGRGSFYICWSALSTVMILNDTFSAHAAHTSGFSLA